MPTATGPPSSTDPRPNHHLGAWLALAMVFGLHAFWAVRMFPTMGSIVDPATPVVMVDHAIHEYHGALGARFFREAGTTWGYDPSFMAGYPETPVWDSSSNPSILFDLIGGGRGGHRAYKVGAFVASLTIPILLASGAWAAGLGASEVVAASALGLLYFWFGFPFGLWLSGLFAFNMAAAGVGLLLGLCVRFDRSPSRAGWLAMGGVGAGLFFDHVTAPILAGGGALAFYATVATRHGRRWHAAVLASVAVTVAANLVWLVPLWRFRGLRSGQGFFMTTNSAWYLPNYLLSGQFDGRLTLILLMTGSAGLAAWWGIGRRVAASAFGGSTVALVLLVAFGSLWGPTRTLEPLRFRVPLCFLLAVPAGSALVLASGGMARRAGGGWRGPIVASAVGAAILGVFAAIDPGFARGALLRSQYRRTLAVGVPTEARGLVDWLRANTDLSARILLEDQLRLLEPTQAESVHWTPLLPELLGGDARMFIGGLYQSAFIRHHEMAAFGDFKLGDRTIDAWSSADVRAYCDLYNVGWVVCWSPLSRFWFDRFPTAKRVATLPRYATPGRPPSIVEHEAEAINRRAGFEVAKRYMMGGESNYAIYRVDRPHSYFLLGRGRIVSVAPNRIELADVEPEGGAAILSMHWMDTWRAVPATVSLGPETYPPDPVDFIRIEADSPIPRLILSNGYRRP